MRLLFDFQAFSFGPSGSPLRSSGSFWPFRLLLAPLALFGPSGTPFGPSGAPFGPSGTFSSACQPSFSFGPSGNFPSWLARSRETLDPIHPQEHLQIRERRGAPARRALRRQRSGGTQARAGAPYLIASRRRVRAQRYRLVGRGAGWANVDIVGPVKREVAWVRVRVWCDWGEVCAPVVGGPCEWVRGVVRD